MEKKYKIILAGPDQEGQVLHLWQQLMEAYGKKAPLTLLQKSYRYAAAHPRQVQVYVAVRQGRVLGTVSLHLGHFSTWNNNWYGHVEDLFVDHKERRQGVAWSLLSHVVEVAKEENLSRLELHTMNNNQAARAMYEKLGFQTSSVVYEFIL
jgi:ribosomal protein S18 acetylase RimI-like enzyme